MLSTQSYHIPYFISRCINKLISDFTQNFLYEIIQKVGDAVCLCYKLSFILWLSSLLSTWQLLTFFTLLSQANLFFFLFSNLFLFLLTDLFLFKLSGLFLFQLSGLFLSLFSLLSNLFLSLLSNLSFIFFLCA